MPKLSPIAVLASRLVRELAACRADGRDAYPIRISDLAARLDPPPDEAAVIKAAGNKSFTARAILTVKGRADAPAVLLEDLPQLVASPLTLEAALRAKGDKSAPPWLPRQLAAVVQKPLQPEFLGHLNRQLEAKELPPFAVTVGKGQAVALYHRDRPPPPSKESQDAERLIDHLRRWRRPGGTVPLVTLPELTTAAGVTAAAVKKAIKEPTFTDAVVQGKYAPLGVLVVLKTDLGMLGSGDLLARLLTDCSRANADAFSVRELVAKLGKPLQQVVAAHLNRDDLAHELPAGFGYISVSDGKGGGLRHFFRLEGVRHTRVDGRQATAPMPSPAGPSLADFAATFDAAFTRLDRERGSNNFVSLIDLRAALPDVPRESFDAGLQQLRRERRYTLTSDERYDGITPEQQAAAIREEGEFLLHVSRGRS